MTRQPSCRVIILRMGTGFGNEVDRANKGVARRRWYKMSLHAFRRNEIARPGISGTDVANAAASVAVAVARAQTNWNGWVKGSLIALSALSGTSVAAVTAVSAFVGYKIVKPARRILTDEADQQAG